MPTPPIITNPVLTGFHPDPSICRVGDEYYMANSTFMWWPGVRLHHSRDLVHWTPCGHALTRSSQLELLGNQDQAGVWAPCLSHAHGKFWLIHTDVKAWTGPYKDSHNYVSTAENIEGPWSEPVHVASHGFDASLFHDDDGRSWYLSVQWDHRMGRNPFSGILLQQFDRNTCKLIGTPRIIFRGTSYGLVEGPHIYRKDGWYYLLTAEGGTSWDHAVTIARSRNLEGPYEVSPQHPLLSSRYNPELSLQRAGHASLVCTANGEWYMAHLCGRPVMPQRKCILGRETALQRLHWPEGEWPVLDQCIDLNTDEPLRNPWEPVLRVRAPHHAMAPQTMPQSLTNKQTDLPAEFNFDHFDSPVLDCSWNSLRIPMDESWLSLTARPSHLRIIGRESPFSLHKQSLVAKRLRALSVVAECQIEFSPQCFQQMAGLVFYYDTTNFLYLRITRAGEDESSPLVLGILTTESGNRTETPNIPIPWQGPVVLRGVLQGSCLRFFYGPHPDKMQPIDIECDATIVSDEYKCETKFTGAMVGLFVQDLTGNRLHADFDWFNIRLLPVK